MHVQIITAEDAHRHLGLLDQTFRLRHQVFVEERGWPASAHGDGRETDEFDDADAIYVIAVDGDEVVGGDRLRATLRPHLMSEVFAPLLHRPAPVGSDVLEVTRHAIAKDRRGGRTERLLMAGIAEFCLAEGVRTLTAVTETWWLPRLQQAGFATRPLGIPAVLDGQDVLAVEIGIDSDTHRRISRMAGLDGPALRRSDPHTGSASAERRTRLH
jgi:acyl-homoserine lactone synthase